jgi:hypothetical protein
VLQFCWCTPTVPQHSPQLQQPPPHRPWLAQIEARTRRDIEDKTSALRQLVGDSYRCARLCHACAAAVPHLPVHAVYTANALWAPQHCAAAYSTQIHRDIIDGTDKIADISAACQDILGNLLTLQEGLGRVATGVSTPRVPTKADGDAVGAAVSPAGQDLGDRDNDGPARKHQELIGEQYAGEKEREGTERENCAARALPPHSPHLP